MSYFGVQLYPNPNNGKFMIEGLNKGSVYQVFDINGRILSSGRVSSSIHEIDLDLTSEGVYYIQSEIDGNTSRLRFMVIK